MLFNPIVRGGDPEHPIEDRFEYVIAFTDRMHSDGIDVAKEVFPDWEDWTLPGDPYPILGPPPEGDPLNKPLKTVKGDRRFMVDTTTSPTEEGDWADRLVASIRKRQNEGSQAEDQ